jgi:hypothetical protein
MPGERKVKGILPKAFGQVSTKKSPGLLLVRVTAGDYVIKEKCPNL